MQRFWNKVDKTVERGCWLWTGARTRAGYGVINIDGSPQYAHRVVLVLGGATIAKREVVSHKCDNPPCVNPSHLFRGTQKDNMADAARKGRLNGRPTPRGDEHYARREPDRLARGEKQGNAKLTAEAVRTARKMRARGERWATLARIFEVHPKTIKEAVTGETWSHL